MEPDIRTTSAERGEDPERPPPWRLRAAAAVLVVVGVLVVAAWSVLETRAPGSTWIRAVAAVAVGLAALALVAGDARRRVGVGVGAALAGAALGAIGTGVVRPRREVEVAAPDGISGQGFLQVATWWPLVAVGAVVLAAGVVLAFGRGPDRGADARARVVATSCAGLLAGLVAIAVVWHEVMTYAWISGRPRRHHGRRLPPDVPTAGPATGGPAGWWREAAADEAASIAAFEDLAARLVAVGAPDELVARARAAARDEVRHARICARLARTVDDRASGPAGREGPVGPGQVALRSREPDGPRAVAPRRVAVVGLAVESLADGVVGEGFAAARLRAGASTIADPAARACLRAMARDEERHAALGADIARWCRSQSPRMVGAALRRVAARLPAETALPAAQRGAEPAALRAAGMVEPAVAQDLWVRARAAALALA